MTVYVCAYIRILLLVEPVFDFDYYYSMWWHYHQCTYKGITDSFGHLLLLWNLCWHANGWLMVLCVLTDPTYHFLHHLFLIFLTGYAVLSSLLIFNHLCVAVKTATSLTITSYGSPFHLHWFFFLGRCCWNTSINLWIWSFTKFSCFLLFPSVCWRI